MTVQSSLRTVYRIPLVLGFVTIIGLLSALLGDGVWDVLSWLLLGVPLFLLALFYGARRPRRSRPPWPFGGQAFACCITMPPAYPKVKENAWTPGSSNSIVKTWSVMVPFCRTS